MRTNTVQAIWCGEKVPMKSVFVDRDALNVLGVRGDEIKQGPIKMSCY